MTRPSAEQIAKLRAHIHQKPGARQKAARTRAINNDPGLVRARTELYAALVSSFRDPDRTLKDIENRLKRNQQPAIIAKALMVNPADFRGSWNGGQNGDGKDKPAWTVDPETSLPLIENLLSSHIAAVARTDTRGAQ